MNLILYWENFTTTFTDGFSNIAFILSIIFSLYVITSKNPVISVLFLIGLFLVVALYLMQVDISYIGLSYILVYVGAVSILFLFILMLINVRVSELITDNNNGIPLSLIVITVFSVVFANSSLYTSTYSFFGKESSDNVTHYVTSNTWETFLSSTPHITSIGNVIYTSYPILLLVVSIILLLAMIGAITITLSGNNNTPN